MADRPYASIATAATSDLGLSQAASAPVAPNGLDVRSNRTRGAALMFGASSAQIREQTKNGVQARNTVRKADISKPFMCEGTMVRRCVASSCQGRAVLVSFVALLGLALVALPRSAGRSHGPRRGAQPHPDHEALRPETFSLLRILESWNPDDVTPPSGRAPHDSLLHLDYSNEVRHATRAMPT